MPEQKPFLGVPVSSKSSMQVPVTVVSQPTVKEVNDAANSTKNREESSKEGSGKGSGEAKEEARPGGEGVLEPDFSDFMNSSIVAIPRTLPTMLDVRCKDPNYRPRWVNCKADHGRCVDDAKARGFRIAKVEEIVGLAEDSLMIKPEGIKYHDVILMVVPTKLLYGWYKFNALDSMNKVNPKRLHQAAKEEGERTLRQGISNEGRNYKDVADLIGIYVPGEGEMSKKGI